MTTQSLIAEALIEELALGTLRDESNFQLTEEQRELRIPSHLIYLTGLVTATTTPDSGAWDESRFEEYQRLYHETLKAEPIVFRSSPRNRATPYQQLSIGQDVHRKQKELELKAKQAETELLLDMDDKKDYDKKSRRAVSRPSNGTQKTKPKTMVASTNHPEPENTLTLEQVVQEIQSESSMTALERDDDPSSWIAVCKKGKSLESSSTTEKEQTRSVPLQLNNEDNIQIDGSDHISLSAVADGDIEKNDKETAHYRTFGPKTAGPAQSTNEAIDGKNGRHTLLLESRIQELERQLAEKEAELQEEREAHVKAMFRKNQDFDNQIQALQLRLYISETRLRTFQDALEQHVEAVSNNISNETNSSVLSNYASPTKKKSMVQPRDEDHEKPPLISRVLSHQIKNQPAATPK
eukprot:scaffold543_cov119-Cylindrotheca_fusiformis.AAC.25